MINQSDITQEENYQHNTQHAPQHVNPGPHRSHMISIILCCLGMLSGIIFSLYGLKVSVDFTEDQTLNVSGHYASRLSDEYNTVRHVAFGADFYTEIYAATAAAANNISTLGSDLAVVSNNISRIGNDLTVVANSIESIGNKISVTNETIAKFNLIPIAIGIFMFLFFALKMCIIIERKS